MLIDKVVKNTKSNKQLKYVLKIDEIEMAKGDADNTKHVIHLRDSANAVLVGNTGEIYSRVKPVLFISCIGDQIFI